MERVLQLVFKKSDDNQKIISVNDPREDVTAEEAHTAMQDLIDSDVFNAEGIGLAEIVEARVKTTEVVVLS